MKHNLVSKAVSKVLENLEEEVSYHNVKKDADQFRENLRKAPRVAKPKNWDLV